MQFSPSATCHGNALRLLSSPACHVLPLLSAGTPSTTGFPATSGAPMTSRMHEVEGRSSATHPGPGGDALTCGNLRSLCSMGICSGALGRMHGVCVTARLCIVASTPGWLVCVAGSRWPSSVVKYIVAVAQLGGCFGRCDVIDGRNTANTPAMKRCVCPATCELVGLTRTTGTQQLTTPIRRNKGLQGCETCCWVQHKTSSSLQTLHQQCASASSLPPQLTHKTATTSLACDC